MLGLLAGAFSFLGGSAFRMIWGEVTSYLNKKQDHQHELEMTREQSKIEAERSVRQESLIRLQKDLNIAEIKTMGEAAISTAEANAFLEAQKEVMKPTGITWVDAWNGCIRPSAATICLALWVVELIVAGFLITDWDREMIGVMLGFYFADRSLGKRGK